jgi:hypothetical protein
MYIIECIDDEIVCSYIISVFKIRQAYLELYNTLIVRLTKQRKL